MKLFLIIQYGRKSHLKYQNSKITKEVLELRNGIQAANSIVNAALESRESCGTHYLEDNE